jgi:hypothetical protein
VKKRNPKVSATSVIFKKISKVNNHPMGENSPNLVTLVAGKRTEIRIMRMKEKKAT